MANPNGTPRTSTRIRTLEAVNREAQRHSKRAISRLAAIMDDPMTPPNVAVSAASAILDRAVGKPKTTAEMTVSGTISVEHQHLEALREIADTRRELRERAIEGKGDWVEKPVVPQGRPSIVNARGKVEEEIDLE